MIPRNLNIMNIGKDNKRLCFLDDMKQNASDLPYSILVVTSYILEKHVYLQIK